MKKHVYLILQNDVYKHDFSNTLAQGLDVFIKVKQGKKENTMRYDSNLILKEIIKDFKPTNGLSQEVFNEHYIDYVNKLYLDFEEGPNVDSESMKSQEERDQIRDQLTEYETNLSQSSISERSEPISSSSFCSKEELKKDIQQASFEDVDWNVLTTEEFR